MMADGGEGVTQQVLPAPEPTRINQAASSTEGLEGAQLKKLRKICLAYQPYTLIAHVRSGQSCRLVEVSAGLRAGDGVRQRHSRNKQHGDSFFACIFLPCRFRGLTFNSKYKLMKNIAIAALCLFI